MNTNVNTPEIDWAKFADSKKYIVFRRTQHSVQGSEYFSYGVAELLFPSKDDWYKSGSKWAFSLPALMAICEGANIRVTGAKSREGDSRDVAFCTVTGSIFMPDGQSREFTADGSFDVQSILDQNFTSKRKDTRNDNLSDDSLRKIVEQERDALRRYRFMRAESSGLSYMIRKILQMPTSFEESDKNKTFVVPVVSPIFDNMFRDSPEARVMFVANALGASKTIFGPHSSSMTDRQLPPNEQRALPPGGGNGDPTTQTSSPAGSSPSTDLPPGLQDPEADAAAKAAAEEAERIANWEAADDFDRVEKLRELWQKKQHTGTKEQYVKLLKDTPLMQARAINQLVSREDAVKGADS